PVISLVDTPGAYPGVAAEQHGQGGAIAASQSLMARLKVPIVACVIGEGGSAILWRDAGEARKAAAAFKPDAAHCLEPGVVDGIVPEPAGGAQNDWKEAARLLKQSLLDALNDVTGSPGDELVRSRREKFRN